MSKKKLIAILIVVVLVIAGIIVIAQVSKKKPLDYTYNHSSATISSIETGEYKTYMQTMQTVEPSAKIVTPSDVSSLDTTGLVKAGYDIEETSNAATFRCDGIQKEDGTLVEDAAGEFLFISDAGKVVWKFNVPVAGYYNIKLNYRTTTYQSKSSSMERKLNIITSSAEVNEAFTEHMAKQSYVFARMWEGDTGEVVSIDSKKDTEHYMLKLDADSAGNDVKPSQKEVIADLSVYFSDDMGYVTDPYQYYFTEGENTLELSAIKECLLVKSIEICPIEDIPTYEEYLASFDGKANNAPKDYSYRIEGEACSATSSPTLYPVTDRTSSKTYPYSAKYTKLNSIGGDNWKVLGDWITWEITVPEDGWYNISLRARQNLVRGMYSHRMVYIDGVIPFQELKSTVFAFSSDWQNVTLGSNENSGSAFKFYLTKGTHEIKMEVTLGAYGSLVEELEAVTQDLSMLYLNIIKYTTVSPDTNRDYSLNKMEDLHLDERLLDARDRLKALSIQIARISSKNADKEDPSGTGNLYKDGKSDKTGVIDTMVEQLTLFLKQYSKVTKQLSAFSTNISSLGTLLTSLREFPLTIDYLVVYADGGNYKLAKANEGFLRSFWDSIVRFYYSFIVDYSQIGSLNTEAEDDLDEVEIQVWMTLGRDQANVIRKLIDNDLGKRVFTINGRKCHVAVNLKLTGGDVLLKAALAGVGPEVAINVDSSLPVNYGLRGASLDLAAAFGDDYWRYVDGQMTIEGEVVPYGKGNGYFHSSSIRQFTFDGSVYAIPEKQIYMTMFVRTDIMQNLYGDDWEDDVPQTWDEVRSMMTDLQTDSLQFYLPVNDSGASALNPAFVTMLYQNEGRLYSTDSRETGLLSDRAMDTFEYWTDFYTKYSFPKFASFINRFRSGEMPIGISYYEMYNTLAVFAPEIRGNWAFYPIPGTKYTINSAEEDTFNLSGGTYPYEVINHTSVASGSAAIIIAKNANESVDKKEAAWAFLRWWSSDVIQSAFGKEMEGILGSSARHTTANYMAFQQLAWPKDDQDTLLQQWGIKSSTLDTQIRVNTHDVNAFISEGKNSFNELAAEYLNKTDYIWTVDADGVYHVYGVLEIPQIAGSYITGREVENAYRTVINNNANAKETLYKYAQNINNEIDRKRSEFGLK